jgi:integrase
MDSLAYYSPQRTVCSPSGTPCFRKNEPIWKSGVCQYLFLHLPYQTGTATSFPETQTASPINIVNVMLWMKKNAYEDSTIKRTAKKLKHLTTNCNTKDPEEVKLYIANKKCSNAYKQTLVESCDKFIQTEKLTWNKPFYQRYDKKRKAPKEELIDFIIKHVRFEMKLKLAMSKDLGERPIELMWLKVQDIDLTTGLISITGAKHTVGREGKLRTDTISLLKIYIQKKNLNATSTIFNTASENLSEEYRHARNRLAEKHNRPELKQVQLYDFRRFKASKTYHLKRDILYVKELLGHRDLRSTLKYVTLFEDTSTWIPVIAETDEEIKQAIQDDCILVCQANGKTFFKKPA